jgi:hypothetical protein
MAFSKLKALLRKAEERTISALWDAIGSSTSSRRKRPQTTSPQQDTILPDRKTL